MIKTTNDLVLNHIPSMVFMLTLTFAIIIAEIRIHFKRKAALEYMEKRYRKLKQDY